MQKKCCHSAKKVFLDFSILNVVMTHFDLQACFLQKLKQGSETSETSSSSASDSNTFYEDDFSSSDDSSDEDGK